MGYWNSFTSFDCLFTYTAYGDKHNVTAAYPDASRGHNFMAADVNLEEESGISYCSPDFIPTAHKAYMQHSFKSWCWCKMHFFTSQNAIQTVISRNNVYCDDSS